MQHLSTVLLDELRRVCLCVPTGNLCTCVVQGPANEASFGE